MIGYRDTNSIFSPPKVYHVDKMVIDGFLFKYKEKIPYTGEVSELRLKEIKNGSKTIFIYPVKFHHQTSVIMR